MNIGVKRNDGYSSSDKNTLTPLQKKLNKKSLQASAARSKEEVETKQVALKKEIYNVIGSGISDM